MFPETIDWHPEALKEADEAIDWYARQSEEVAGVFLDELRRSLHRIADNPGRYARALGKSQRQIMARFPYTIIYRVSNERIRILAVAHTSRRPGYWLKREI
jgi:plasmid stabilization system protein ParE